MILKYYIVSFNLHCIKYSVMNVSATKDLVLHRFKKELVIGMSFERSDICLLECLL